MTSAWGGAVRMQNKKRDSLQVGPWHVEPALGQVHDGSTTLTLRPREMDLLVCLARHGGDIVTVDDIIAAVWKGVAVTNDSLYFSIGQLRKALDGHGGEASIIETIPKRGYRLTVPVTAPVEETAHRAKPETATVASVYGGNRVSRRLAWISACIAAVIGVLSIAGPAGLWPGTSVAPVAANSIAVMPFIDLSPDTDYTYFSDGISEELLNRLTRVPGLQVAARTSSFAFKDRVADVVEIGEALGVASILEGSVRKEGDRVRISAQLIDARSGFHLWSDTYDQELGSVFELQNTISHRIIEALELELGSVAANATQERRQRTDPTAIEHYLMGLEAQQSYSFDAVLRAARHFESALSIDPGFVQARIELAETKVGLLSVGASFDKALLDEAESLATAALEAGADGGDAYRVLGIVHGWRGDHEQAARWLELALNAAPSDSAALVAYAGLKRRLGDVAEAQALFERALRIDPFGIDVLMKYGRAQWIDGAVDDARATFARGADLHPKNPNFPWLLGLLQVSQFGELAGGLQNFLRAAELDPRDFEIAAYIAITYLTLDMPAAARPWIDRALERGPRVATSLAAESVWLALGGDEERAGRLSASVLEGDGYYFRGHALLTDALHVLATDSLIRDRQPEAAIALMQKSAAAGKKHDREYGVEESNADRISPRVLLSLASAYKAAGQPQRAARTLRALDSYDTSGARHGQPWCSSATLIEAESRAIMGDNDAALELLGQVADDGPLLNWQVQIAGNQAFDELRGDPRFNDVLARIEDSVALQRQRLPGNILLSRISENSVAVVPR